MMGIGALARRVSYLLNRRKHDEAIQQEMEAHRALLGAPERFGNTQRLREEAHDAWGWAWLDDLARDSRLAARSLARSPGFASVAFSLERSLAWRRGDR